MQDVRRMKGMLSFPRDYPFTEAGEAYWARRHKEALEINEKKPPVKRQAPVISLANILHAIAAWNPSIITYVKQEDTIPTRSLIAVIGETHLRDFLPPDDCRIKPNASDENVPRDLISSGAIQLPSSLLLTVQLKPIGSRGLPMDLASLYSPSPEDILSYVTARQTYEERKTSTKCSKPVDKSLKCGNLWSGVQLPKSSAEVNTQVVFSIF